jgi:hypothetical protein
LLCRYYGLHRVKLPHGKKIHFVVMSNVFPPSKDIHETYDLKVTVSVESPTKSLYIYIALIGLYFGKILAGRRNQKEPFCSHERSQLGREKA